MPDQPKNRKFLKPLGVAIAALLASASTDAMASMDIHTAIEKAHQVVIERSVDEVNATPLIIQSAEQNDLNKTAYHTSHSSHGSHGSHGSHSSHYSSRW